MSKILLIKPRFLFDLEFKHITQPLGLMYIGAMLKRKGHEPKIHDCAVDNKDLKILRRTIKEWKPDFIGISIMITELQQTKTIVKIIREILPGIPITFGGPWPSAYPEESIKTFGANFVVMGEGEFVFLELVDAINKRRSTDSISGTASLVNGMIKMNPRRLLTEDELNSLPFPAWELLNNRLYAKMHSFACVGIRPYMSVITSRGCPYKCAYCHQTMGKNYRTRSAESVLAEMEELRFKYGFKEFEIIDDCFNIDRERMHKILCGIRDRLRDVKLYFPSGLRADILEPEDILTFKKAGTVALFFAIETSSPRLQKMIHKNLIIEKAVSAINASVRAGIYTVGFFMLGFPTETYEEASATVDFAVRTNLHRAYFFYPMPFAGTELSKMAEDVLKNKYNGSDPLQMNFFTGMFNISAMSDGELESIYRRAWKRFYMNPKRLIRLIIRYPRLISLPRYALTGLMKIIPEK